MRSLWEVTMMRIRMTTRRQVIRQVTRVTVAGVMVTTTVHAEDSRGRMRKVSQVTVIRRG
jgi:hypothetical protein